jgi:hypothetical protein
MEKKQDELQGKNWIDIDGNTTLSVGVRTRANGTPTPSKASNNGRENEGYNGGEA